MSSAAIWGGGRLQRGVDATFGKRRGGLGWNLCGDGPNGRWSHSDRGSARPEECALWCRRSLRHTGRHHTGKAEDARAAKLPPFGESVMLAGLTLQAAFLAGSVVGEFLTLVGVAHDNRAFDCRGRVACIGWLRPSITWLVTSTGCASGWLPARIRGGGASSWAWALGLSKSLMIRA